MTKRSVHYFYIFGLSMSIGIDINKNFLANTIRGVESHNKREVIKICVPYISLKQKLQSNYTF